MDPVPHYQWDTLLELTPYSSSRVLSSITSFAIVPDIDGVEPATDAISSKSSSKEEVPDDPYYPRSHSGRY